MANEFKVRKGLIVQGSGSTILDILGSQGELFSVTDSLVGSLFSVNDISGIPIMEVFSDNTIKLGTFNNEAIIVSGSRTGMGIATPQAELHISGANNDSLFRIQSPASASIMFVSGSGNVGIGTLTPTNTLNVNGTTLLQGGQTTVRGSGATSATTALRVENSAATARLTILDDGTSAFNTSHLYVSSSGNIGVGTTTPGVTLDVVGQIRASSTMFNSTTQTNTIQLSSATNLRFLSASVETARYDNAGWGFFNTAPTAKVHISGASADALFRVSSPSAASALFVSGSGNIGIGTGTPLLGVLDVNGAVRIRSSNQLYFGGTGAGDWQGAISGQNNGLLLWANLLTINNSGYSSPATQSFAINTSQNVAIGPHSPTVRLHVSGASNAGLFEIDSPAVNNIIYVSGSGNVGIGTGTPTNTLQVVGGITATSITASIISASSGITGSLFGTSSWAVSASQALTASFLNGAFLQNGNSFGATAVLGTNDNQDLQFETNGSVRMTISSSGNIGIGTTPTSSFRLNVSGSARFGSGSVGFASGLGQIHAVDRAGAYITATQTTSSIVTFMGADNNGGIVGTYSNNDFLIRSNNTDRILLQGGNVGIQTAPAEYIHLSSDPAISKYLQIDARQNSNSPPITALSSAKNGYGIVVNENYLAEPDYWMEIKNYDGVVVLIPCYLPA